MFWQEKRFTDINEYIQWAIGTKTNDLNSLKQFNTVESTLLNFILAIQIGTYQQAFDVINDIENIKKVTSKGDPIVYNEKTLKF